MFQVRKQDLLESTVVCLPRPVPVSHFLSEVAQEAAMACLLFDPSRRPGDLSNLQAALEELQDDDAKTPEEASLERMRMYRAALAKEKAVRAARACLRQERLQLQEWHGIMRDVEKPWLTFDAFRQDFDIGAVSPGFRVAVGAPLATGTFAEMLEDRAAFTTWLQICYNEFHNNESQNHFVRADLALRTGSGTVRARCEMLFRPDFEDAESDSQRTEGSSQLCLLVFSDSLLVRMEL